MKGLQFDVHPNQIADSKTGLQNGAAGVLGEEKAEQQAKIDVTRMQATIGAFAAENDFLEAAHIKAACSMRRDDPSRARAAYKPAGGVAGDQSLHALRSAATVLSRKSEVDAAHRRTACNLSVCRQPLLASHAQPAGADRGLPRSESGSINALAASITGLKANKYMVTVSPISN